MILWYPLRKNLLPILAAPGVRQRLLTFFLWTPVCIKYRAYSKHTLTHKRYRHKNYPQHRI